jgi:biotin synthase-related radical SAM superfamily protein
MVVFSLRPDKTRFCYNCKHFIDSVNGVEFGKCGAFPRIDDDYTNYLVSGKRDIHMNDANYHYCGTARSSSSMCGEDGSLYRIKYHKFLVNTPDDTNNKKMK